MPANLGAYHQGVMYSTNPKSISPTDGRRSGYLNMSMLTNLRLDPATRQAALRGHLALHRDLSNE
jgi:hypothetical protein